MAEITKEQIEAAAKKLMEGYTLSAVKGISENELEAVYSVGFNFYQTGRLEDAQKIFSFLVMFNHLSPKFWMGLGAVYQVKKEFDQALTAYGYASFLDLTDPRPQFHAAECFWAKGDRTNALSALAALEEFAPANVELGREYRTKAAELKAKIEQQ